MNGTASDAEMTTRDAGEVNTDLLVAAACRLVGSSNEVRSVRVLAPGRPTYDALWRYRDSAGLFHVRLSVDGAGVVTVRPKYDARE